MKLLHLFLSLIYVGIVNAQNSPTLAQANTFATQQKAAFEENKGQVWNVQKETATNVKYHFQQKGMDIFMLSKGMVYQFTKIHYPEGYKASLKKDLSPTEKETQKALIKQIRTETYRMDMELVNANPNANIITDGKSKDYVQYYNRNALDVHSFEQLRYQDVYPGIDWVIYTTKQGLKYDFIVQPGADPSQIQLKYTHHEDLKINADGSFTLSNSMGTVTEQAPISFQEGQDIQTAFKLDGDIISFDLSNYDKTKVLTIDPSLLWATYYGGTDVDEAFDCTIDGAGNLYVAGQTGSFSNIAYGGHQNTTGNYTDAFLAKFNPAGVRIWATYYGSGLGGITAGYACAVDGNGNVYLAGETDSQVYISSGGHQNNYGGGLGNYEDAFLVKFNSAGVRQWATYYGGDGPDHGYDCAVDGAGNVFLVGRTSSSFNIAFGSNTFGGSAFIVKFNSAGVRQWATYYGGNANGCAVDGVGNVYVSGWCNSTSNIAFNGHQNTYGGGIHDVFLVKFSSLGVRLWATYYGGTSDDGGASCTVDGAGNVYLSGSSSSLSNIASSGYQNIFSGGAADAFLVKFNPAGLRLWATYYGGMGFDGSSDCAVDVSGNVYLIGGTASSSNIAFGGHQNTFSGGYLDAFLVKFNPAGLRLWATYHGGADSESGSSCAVDGTGNIYFVGTTDSDSNIASNGHQNTFGGWMDAYMVKLASNNCSTMIGTDVQTACGSYTWIDGNVYTSSTNFATFILTDTAGCDSIVNLNLTINNPNTGTDAQTACNSYTWMDGNTYTASNNSATFTLTNSDGCDSVITLDLTINSIDTTTSISGTTIITNATGATYQWVDCASNFSSINNATNQSFTPTQNGDYAVIITQNGCVDTSSCHTIIVVGLNDLATNNNITIYPNPTTENIHIDFGKVEQEVSLKLYSVDGKLIQSKTQIQGSLYQLKLPKTTGIYVLEIKTDKGISHYKMIKE